MKYTFTVLVASLIMTTNCFGYQVSKMAKSKGKTKTHVHQNIIIEKPEEGYEAEFDPAYFGKINETSHSITLCPRKAGSTAVKFVKDKSYYTYRVKIKK